jgi:hypothetical protein
MTTATGGQPAQIAIDYPEKLSRGLIFIKWLLLIPHFIIMYVLTIVMLLASIIAWFATVITGRYPRGLFDFFVGYERWRLRLTSYQFLQTDAYPPFSFADAPGYPVRLEVEYPERVARWRPFFAGLLAIPAEIVLVVFVLIAEIASIIAWFAILFTGRYPRGIFDFVTRTLVLSTRTALYSFWAISKYPLGD